MTQLALVYGERPLSLTDIAGVEHLPAGYLEQLAIPLRKAGLIQGTRGAHGGYRLSRPPGELTVGAVIRALEGPVAPVECLMVAYEPGSCVREPVCLTRSVWQRVKESVDQVLDSITLADLCASGDQQGVPAFISVAEESPTEVGDPCAVPSLGR
jgi:Rrf2 family protein